MRLLIFGSRGQLGQELVSVCEQQGIQTILSDRSHGGDIADPEQVQSTISKADPTLVVNAAAFTKVDEAELDRARAYRENAYGPNLLAKSCRNYNYPMIHISTDYVFNGDKNSPYVEIDPVCPLGVYGASKEAGERSVRIMLKRHIILRTAWLYGARGENFLRTMMRFAATRESWGVVSDQCGNPTATIDLALAILEVAKNIYAGGTPWGTYHFAGSGDATWYEFATEIVGVLAKYTNRRADIAPIATADYPTRARRPRNSRLNSRLFEATFGFKAKPWQIRTAEVIAELVQARSGDSM